MTKDNEIERLKTEIFQTRKFWSDHADKDRAALRAAAEALFEIAKCSELHDEGWPARYARAVLAKLAEGA